MSDASLLTSPGAGYFNELLAALDRAERFWLVMAFASPAGIELFAPALERVLNRPNGQGQLVVAVDRWGFNATRIFEALLGLKQRAGPRLALGIVPEERGFMHANALLTKSPAGIELIVGSANLTHDAFQENHELGLMVRGVNPEIESAFQRFSQALAPVSLDGDNAAEFLRHHGLMPAASSGRAENPSAAVSSAWRGLRGILGKQPLLAASRPVYAVKNFGVRQSA